MGGKGSGGSRMGSGKNRLSEDEKSVKATFQIKNGTWKYFCSLVPDPAVRHKLIGIWIRIYSIAGGETDRLLTQSPLAARLLNYLEAQEGVEAQELGEKLQLLIVNRELDELRAEGTIEKLPGGSYLI